MSVGAEKLHTPLAIAHDGPRAGRRAPRLDLRSTDGVTIVVPSLPDHLGSDTGSVEQSRCDRRQEEVELLVGVEDLSVHGLAAPSDPA